MKLIDIIQMAISYAISQYDYYRKMDDLAGNPGTEYAAMAEHYWNQYQKLSKLENKIWKRKDVQK